MILIFKQKKKANNQEEQAVASFASFTKYKQSYIQGLFLSQYQSTIPCLRCGKLSSTFDPYTSLSLEIPSKPKRVLYSTMVYANDNQDEIDNRRIPMRLGFEFQRKGTLHELRAGIVELSGIQNFVITEITPCGLTRVLSSDEPLSILPNTENSLYAVELGQEIHHSKKDEIEKQVNEIVLVISNVVRRRKQNKR